MKRITSIDIHIPCSSSRQVNDCDNLLTILSEADNLSIGSSGVLQTNFENELSPITTFPKQKELKSPVISFVTPDEYKREWSADNLVFGFNASLRNQKLSDEGSSDTSPKSPLPVTSSAFLNKMTGNVRELNHSGINFSPSHINQNDYKLLKKELCKRSNLYNYPSGEEWPFIIPATKDEFASDIKDESINRNPKFEIVHSEFNTRPVIQLDVASKLTKEEVFDLFPDPYGVSYDGLEDFFRSVFIDVDWGRVLLRFDIGFGRGGLDFGYWMIKEGGRVLP